MPKPLSEADKLKNEKSLKTIGFPYVFQGWPFPDETKIHENPLSELTFFETKKSTRKLKGFGIKNNLKNDL